MRIAIAAGPDPQDLEARVVAYERDLRVALQTQRKLTDSLQTLMFQDQQLRGSIMATAAAAQQQMQMAERMPELRLERTPVDERKKNRRPGNRDDGTDDFRVVDQTQAKTAMAMGAAQLASMLPSLNATLWRNNAALAQLVKDGEANRMEFRKLADAFGRRSIAESVKAVALMKDALFAEPGNENARMVLALAQIRLGDVVAGDNNLGMLVDSAGPWVDVALASRGHLRAAGWLGPDAATRRQGAAFLNRAIALKSRQAEPLLFRALAYWRDRKWSLAELDLKAALRLRADHVDGLRMLAGFYAANPANVERRLDEAEAAARRACELTADCDPACLEALAAVLARRGTFEAAIETQQRCVEVAHGDFGVRAQQRLADYQVRKPPSMDAPFSMAPAGSVPAGGKPAEVAPAGAAPAGGAPAGGAPAGGAAPPKSR